MSKPWVSIYMGSDSDLPIMEEAAKILKELAVPFEITVSSAHRTPDRTRKLIRDAEARGAVVFIAGAGSAAHLAGVIAAETVRPVIGVPIDASPLNGLDALLSTVQMPGGIPVACVAIGKAGARNAGILAAQIISGGDTDLHERLANHRRKMAESVEKKAEAVKKKLSDG